MCTCATFKKQGVTFTMLRDPSCPQHGRDGCYTSGCQSKPENGERFCPNCKKDIADFKQTGKVNY